MRTNTVFSILDPISKKDRIVKAIQDAIVNGSIKPSEMLVENKISAHLGVGTPLVREALIELEHKGFVRKIPYKGTFVTSYSKTDVKQLFQLRIELESLAVTWAKDNATPADIDELRNHVRQMRLSAEAFDYRTFFESDLAFHRKFWQMSGNKYLIESLERIVIPLFAFSLMRESREHKSYFESVDNHERLIETFCQSNAKTLRSLTKRELAGWKKSMLERAYPDKK